MGQIVKLRRPRGSWYRPLLVLVVIGVIAALALVTVPVDLPRWHGASSAATFRMCGFLARDNCVVDGDTFRFQGEKIRIADIDTPELSPSRCDRELELGTRAKQRLLELLNTGPFVLVTRGRDRDQYGRKLRVVVRDGRSVGEVLVAEGLARVWTGHKEPWCG